MNKITYNKNLEEKLEEYIKSAYSKWEYIRCNNLLNLLAKIKPTNKVLLKYINKIDDNMVAKQRRRWSGWFSIVDIFKSPKIYIFILFLYFTGRFK